MATCGFCLLLHSTFKVIAKKTQFICKDDNTIIASFVARLKLSSTSIMATMGAMNVAIAPIPGLIQQL